MKRTASPLPFWIPLVFLAAFLNLLLVGVSNGVGAIREHSTFLKWGLALFCFGFTYGAFRFAPYVGSAFNAWRESHRA